MSILNQVYRVRTNPQPETHMAKQGSLVVIESDWEKPNFFGLCVGVSTGEPILQRFRPCDLSRLPFHEEINK